MDRWLLKCRVRFALALASSAPVLAACRPQDCGPADLSPATIAAAERQGTELRHVFAVFEKFHDAYPLTLDQLQLAPELTRMACGTAWTYAPGPKGTSYELYLGDYGKNGFVLHWDTSSAKWRWDT